MRRGLSTLELCDLLDTYQMGIEHSIVNAVYHVTSDRDWYQYCQNWIDAIERKINTEEKNHG